MYKLYCERTQPAGPRLASEQGHLGSGLPVVETGWLAALPCGCPGVTLQLSDPIIIFGCYAGGTVMEPSKRPMLIGPLGLAQTRKDYNYGACAAHRSNLCMCSLRPSLLGHCEVRLCAN